MTAIAQLGQKMKVNEVPPEEVARLREAVKPVVDKFAADVGAEVMAAATAELEAIR
jgi:TRAP-type C4-dicarboxylate transport system substrate-binding protein